LVAVLVIRCCVSSLAQDPNQEEVVRVRTDLVTIPVTVVDSRGRRVAGLRQEDFILRDVGNVKEIGHFSSGTDRVALIFLLDGSGSARDYLANQREAALGLFSRFGPGSQVAVALFGNRINLAVPFTDQVSKIRAGFDFVATAGQHSAIFDSASGAVRLFDQRQRDPTERRIIVLTSDGLDNASSLKAGDVINCARSKAVSFYVIHFPLFAPYDGRLMARATAKGFRDLAEKTGGRFFTAGNVELALKPGALYDLSAVFKSIEEDLASQYILGFYAGSTTPENALRNLEVSLAKTAKRKLRVIPLRGLTESQCTSLLH
jgi:Ca-activated chloride channel family protein